MTTIPIIEEYRSRLARQPRSGAYSFGTGRLAVLSAQLLGIQTLEQLANQVFSLEQLKQVLDQAGYPQAAEPETRIRLGRQAAARELKSAAPQSVLARALLLEQDLHNLKLFLKYLRSTAEQGGVEREAEIPSLLQAWVYPEAYVAAEELYRALLEQSASERPAYGALAQLLDWAREEESEWQRDYGMQGLDARLDQRRFIGLLDLAEVAWQAGDRETATYLRAYTELRADMANYSTALRLLKGGYRAEIYARSCVAGGRVSPEEAVQAYRQGAAGLDQHYARSAAAYLVTYGQRYREGEGGALSLGQDRLLAAFAQLGQEPGASAARVASYFIYRELEARNLRLLLSSRQQAERSAVYRKLRPNYQGGVS